MKQGQEMKVEQNEVEERAFFLDVAAIGAKAELDVFRARTIQLQQYLFIVSFLSIVTSLGIYSVKELTIGPAVLVTSKVSWISFFEIVATAYCAVTFGASAWVDTFVYREKIRVLAGQLRPYVDRATNEFHTPDSVTARIDEIWMETEQLKREPDGSDRFQKLVNEQFELMKIVHGRTELFREKVTFAIRAILKTRKLRAISIILDIVFPLVLAGIAIVCVWSATKWVE
jgi:hypothetical protein